jgi:MFS family permease
VYAAAAYPVGCLADRWGTRPSLICGLSIYAGVYIGFAQVSSSVMCWGLFAIYGIYAALTEGVAKAWLSNLAPEQRGTALGIQSALASLAAIIASTGTGLLWTFVDSTLPFYIAAMAAVITAFGLLTVNNQTD